MRAHTAVLVAGLFLLTASASMTGALPPSNPLVSDGVTPTATPDGTTVVLPEGWPAVIRKAVLGVEVTAWNDAPVFGPIPMGEESGVGTLACTRYHAGFVKDPAGFNMDLGLSARVKTQNLPFSVSAYCDSAASVFTPLLVFDNGDYGQAGWMVRKVDSGTSARFMCQTHHGTSYPTLTSTSLFPNDRNFAFLVIKDSGGTWRTYYADIDFGGATVEIGCTIPSGLHSTTEGNGGQWFGEISGETSTSGTMGPMRWTNVQWLDDARRWHTTVTLQTAYNPAGPGGSWDAGSGCPPYGAGSISSGVLTPGSGSSCTEGNFAYP